MKFIKLISVSSILLITLVGHVNAAKENHDRNKEYKELLKEEAKKECNEDKKNCKKLLKKKEDLDVLKKETSRKDKKKKFKNKF